MANVKFEYLFLDIEWNQAPKTTDIEEREPVQIGIVAVDAKDVYKRQTLFGAFTNGVSAENLYYRIIGDKMPYGENASTNTNIATGKTDEYMQSDAFAYDLWYVKRCV